MFCNLFIEPKAILTNEDHDTIAKSLSANNNLREPLTTLYIGRPILLDGDQIPFLTSASNMIPTNIIDLDHPPLEYDNVDNILEAIVRSTLSTGVIRNSVWCLVIHRAWFTEASFRWLYAIAARGSFNDIGRVYKLAFIDCRLFDERIASWFPPTIMNQCAKFIMNGCYLHGPKLEWITRSIKAGTSHRLAHLTVFELSNCGLTDADFECLIRHVIQARTTFNRLNLSHNKIGDTKLAFVENEFKSLAINELNLEYNNIDDEGLEAIARQVVQPDNKWLGGRVFVYGNKRITDEAKEKTLVAIADDHNIRRMYARINFDRYSESMSGFIN